MHFAGVLAYCLLLFLTAGADAPPQASAQDRVRIGVPLFPTVSYPVFIAHERGLF